MKPILLHSHTRPLTQLKFNKEGDLLFSSGKDISWHVWRTSNGEKLGSYDGHSGSVWCVDISADTTLAVSGSGDTTCKVWDTEKGTIIHNLTASTPVRTVNFKNDKHIITITTDATMGKPCEILTYDLRDENSLKDGIKFFRTDSQPLNSNNKVTAAIYVAYDDLYLTSHLNGEVTQWRAATGEKLRSSCVHTNQINSIQKSTDEDFIVTASKDTTAKLLDVWLLEVVKEYKTPQAVNSASLSSLEDHVLLGGGQDSHEVTTTDTRSGKFVCRFYHKIYESEIGRVKGHFGPVNTVAFHPDGRSFASGGEDGLIRYHYFDDSYFNFKFSY
ncbi:eukaryotic translation initiation factor 3 subunit I-like [Zophobas morio]|uniref:eukaryotic translation initiation factor 3 subunit I-like n=1 Tax=Zophobas morio TaxID=2755281 RepID=UPI003083D6E8